MMALLMSLPEPKELSLATVIEPQRKSEFKTMALTKSTMAVDKTMIDI
jgi:hypothetical protein